MSLEEKNSSLMDASSRLREEVRNSEARRTQLEQELSRLNRDYNDLIRKLSVAEASLEMAQKVGRPVPFEVSYPFQSVLHG